MSLSLKEKANKDKEFLINQTNEFLKSENNFSEPLETSRDKINEAVKKGNFSEALQNLEIFREQKTGIDLIIVDSRDGNTPILIRDSRNNTSESRILGTEGFEMQYLNVIRAAIEIADIENKPELKDQLKDQAANFINNFHEKNKEQPQETISINVKNKINNVITFLEKSGIEKPHKKINVAKDFQNFNDQHFNIVTLSKIKDTKGKNHTVIEAEVALKGITEEQKMEYKNRDNKKWFTKMPTWEQKLVNRYVEKITNGNHVIPTQLRQIVGMKNAFEKITGIADPNSESFEILHNSKHAGTLASIARDDDSKQKITDLNAKQAQEWIGKAHILHANTLNSGSELVKKLDKDAAIVVSTKTAINYVGGFYTNTAFNKFRKIASFSNLTGVKERLNDLADSLPQDKIFQNIKTHLRPSSKINKLLGIKPKSNFKELLHEAQKIYKFSPGTIETLTIAADLKKDIDKSNVIFFRGDDKDNISADISKKLNYLNNRILNSKDPILEKALKHETLTMCASGKDRTGLAEHDQSAGVIASKLNMNIEDIDKQLLKAGHTAGQAGGIHAGGATIGCYGTLPVTSQGFPEYRKEVLQPIMEPTAPNNKIKLLKKNQIINEKKEQKIALETPNMLKDEKYNTTILPKNTKTLLTTKQYTTNLDKHELVKPIINELKGVLKARKDTIHSSSFTPSNPKHKSSRSK